MTRSALNVDAFWDSMKAAVESAVACGRVEILIVEPIELGLGEERTDCNTSTYILM